MTSRSNNFDILRNKIYLELIQELYCFVETDINDEIARPVKRKFRHICDWFYDRESEF